MTKKLNPFVMIACIGSAVAMSACSGQAYDTRYGSEYGYGYNYQAANHAAYQTQGNCAPVNQGCGGYLVYQVPVTQTITTQTVETPPVAPPPTITPPPPVTHPPVTCPYGTELQNDGSCLTVNMPPPSLPPVAPPPTYQPPVYDPPSYHPPRK